MSLLCMLAGTAAASRCLLCNASERSLKASPAKASLAAPITIATLIRGQHPMSNCRALPMRLPDSQKQKGHQHGENPQLGRGAYLFFFFPAEEFHSHKSSNYDRGRQCRQGLPGAAHAFASLHHGLYAVHQIACRNEISEYLQPSGEH